MFLHFGAAVLQFLLKGIFVGFSDGLHHGAVMLGKIYVII